METSNAAAVLSGLPNDPTHLVTPAPCPHQSNVLLDGEKTGATLLFSGIFLSLVGTTFTATGWQSFYANPSIDWTQLLGPVLISVGGTFILISVCKFGIVSCWPCTQQEEEVFVIPAREQASRGHPFMFRGINQPVVLQGASAMLCVPPSYDFITQEVCQAVEPGVPAALPPYDAVYCVDNAAFTAEGCSARSRETEDRGSSRQKTEDERGRSEGSSSTCSHPPAYEDLYPSFHKRDPT